MVERKESFRQVARSARYKLRHNSTPAAAAASWTPTLKGDKSVSSSLTLVGVCDWVRLPTDHRENLIDRLAP